MKLLFTMYDKDRSGTLSKAEVTEMLRFGVAESFTPSEAVTVIE